jgi:hypothetical protein
MQDEITALNEGATSDERIRAVLGRHIKRAYDRRLFTRATLASESGVHISQIDQIVSHDPAKQRRVTAEDALNLAYALGESAVMALMGCIYYAAFRPARTDATPSQIVADGMRQLTIIAEAAADGRIDHTERHGCIEAADRLIMLVSPISSVGAAA